MNWNDLVESDHQCDFFRPLENSITPCRDGCS